MSSPDQEPGRAQPTKEEPTQEKGEAEEEEQEGEGECGFCLFMKGGGCKEEFIAWEECIDEAEKKKEDLAEKCFEVTRKLRICMEAYSDYYEPILRAEKRAEEEVVKEFNKEKEAEEEEAPAPDVTAHIEVVGK